jgi:hypothetical protein
MTTISKTTITFTVLHRTDAEPFDTIDDALYESREGNAVGMETSFETVEVPDEQVEGELLALYNDGTFFDSDLGEEE